MPKAKDGGVRFVTVNDDLEFWLEETVNQGYDDVEGKDDEVIFLGSPLKVMPQTDLNGSGVSEGGGNNRFVVRNMEELRGGKTFVLKGSELLIGPPVLVPRHYLQKPGQIGGEEAGCEFRGDY